MPNIKDLERAYQDEQRIELLNETDYKWVKGEITEKEYKKTLFQIKKEYNEIIARIA